MSTMFSSKSSGGPGGPPGEPGGRPAPPARPVWRVVVRGLMTAILPPRTRNRVQDRPRRAPPAVSGGGEAAVDADDLAGHVVAGLAGQEHRDAFEVGRQAVAADHG